MPRNHRRWAIVSVACAAMLVACIAAAIVWRRPSEVLGRDSQPTAAMRAARGDAHAHRAPIVGHDWPCLFGPARDSVSLETPLALDWPTAGPPVVWNAAIGAGYSAPVVADGRVIVFHRQRDREVIESFDAASGESQWRFEYPTAYRCRYEYSSGPYSTPVVSGDRVFAIGAEGRCHALDLATGALVWQRSLVEEYDVPTDGMFPIVASSLVEDGRVILNLGGRKEASGIVALDAETGRTLWTATDDGASYATPIAATIHGRRYTFVFTRQALVALDAATGAIAWRIEFHARNRDTINAASPVVYGDIVFVSAWQAGCLCVRVLPDGGFEEIWRDKRRNLDSQYNNLVCLDGCVYGFSSLDRSFRCLDLMSGLVRWRWSSELGRGATLAADGRFIILDEFGALAALDIDRDQPIVRSLTTTPILEAPCYSAPALAHGRLYVRNEHEIKCLDAGGADGGAGSR